MRLPPELKNLYGQGRLLPFVGAGISRSVEWEDNGVKRRGILWREMVDKVIQELGFDDPELLRVRGVDLQILEYFKAKRAGLAPITNWLYAEMRAPDSALSRSRILTALARLEQCSTYYTTNYDDFLERAIVLNGRPSKTVALEQDMGRREPGIVEVVKFHGDFNQPTEMVISESDYQRRLAFESPMDFRFRSDLLGRTVLFLGYSFSDPNVAYLFHVMNAKFSGLPTSQTGRRGYIIVPNPSDFEMTLFERRNIEVIAVDERTLVEDIEELLLELRS